MLMEEHKRTHCTKDLLRQAPSKCKALSIFLSLRCNSSKRRTSASRRCVPPFLAFICIHANPIGSCGTPEAWSRHCSWRSAVRPLDRAWCGPDLVPQNGSGCKQGGREARGQPFRLLRNISPRTGGASAIPGGKHRGAGGFGSAGRHPKPLGALGTAGVDSAGAFTPVRCAAAGALLGLSLGSALLTTPQNRMGAGATSALPTPMIASGTPSAATAKGPVVYSKPAPRVVSKPAAVVRYLPSPKMHALIPTFADATHARRCGATAWSGGSDTRCLSRLYPDRLLCPHSRQPEAGDAHGACSPSTKLVSIAHCL